MRQRTDHKSVVADFIASNVVTDHVYVFNCDLQKVLYIRENK
jgi:hypothetical protein